MCGWGDYGVRASNTIPRPGRYFVCLGRTGNTLYLPDGAMCDARFRAMYRPLYAIRVKAKRTH